MKYTWSSKKEREIANEKPADKLISNEVQVKQSLDASKRF